MVGEPFDDFERWAAEVRATEAVDARVRQRWLETQAAESADFAGVVAALAEDGVEAVVTTTTGRRHAGRVAVVGVDFVVVRRSDQRSTIVALWAVASVTPTARARPVGVTAAGAEQAAGALPVTTRLVDVLAQAAADRPRLVLFAGEARMPGELLGAGTDVVTLRTNTVPPGTAYVPVASLSEIALFDAG